MTVESGPVFCAVALAGVVLAEPTAMGDAPATPAAQVVPAGYQPGASQLATEIAAPLALTGPSVVANSATTDGKGGVSAAAKAHEKFVSDIAYLVSEPSEDVAENTAGLLCNVLSY